MSGNRGRLGWRIARNRLAVAAVFTIVALGACSGSPRQSATSPSPSASVPGELRGSMPVRFESSDGIALEGRVFGTGSVGVVLAHGVEDEAQGSWFAFARVLEQHGYRALTFNFRGFCPRSLYGCSAGRNDPPNTWRDVKAATDYLRGQGVTKVFFIGSSLGARSILWAAAQDGVDVSGVVPISASQKAASAYSPGYDLTPAVLKRIAEPKLFIAGESEPDLADDARSMFASSNQPRRLALLPSGQHGSVLVTVAEPKVVARGTKLILDFITANS